MAEHDHEHGHQGYQKGSLSLWGAVSLGTGVMIGAGIFALTGQVAQLARALTLTLSWRKPIRQRAVLRCSSVKLMEKEV